MADNKKYYYMKIKENFFESEDMIILESQQDGMLYSNILIKLYLKSLKHDGKLMFKDSIPYNPQMIATITRHQVGTVEKALSIFAQLGLIEILSNGAIYMNEIELFIGKSSTEGERKKRARIAIQQSFEGNQEIPLLEDGQNADKRPPELELELELELEKELEKKKKIKDMSSKPDKIPYAKIINHLNAKANKNFRSNTGATKKLIDARYNEGFTLDNFFTVIDKKVAEWQGTDMETYLQPSTLFGNKFDNYLNQVIKTTQTGGNGSAWNKPNTQPRGEGRTFVEQFGHEVDF